MQNARVRIDQIRIRREADESPDLSYLGEYGQDYRPGAVDRAEANGSLDRREYRYWYPGSNHFPHDPKSWAHVSAKDKAQVRKQYGSLAKADQAYMMQDYQRMEAYNRGDWGMVGLWAEAAVSYLTGAGGHRRETLRSGGLWGIESDSDKAYFAEVEQDELADLRRHLEAFGADTSDFDAKAKEASHA